MHTTPRCTAQPLALLLTWGIPSGIIASFVCLALRPDLRTAVPLLVGTTAAATLLLALALRGSDTGTVRWSPATIIAVASLLRLLFLIRPAELSDDVYRYLWDGLTTLAGVNPYAAAPLNAPPADATADHVRRLVNHPELVTVYPPTAQLVFAAGALAGKSVLGMKGMLVFLDLAACLLIIRLLGILRLPPERAVLYAWHPLPVLEIAGAGHVDGVGLLLLLIALTLLAPVIVRRRGADAAVGGIPPLAAGLTCAGAVLVKLFPLVFLPGVFFLVRGRARRLLACGILAGAALLTLPFLPDLGNGLATLGLYARDWEFSGFAFRNLRRLTGSGTAARLILSTLFLGVMAASYGRLLRRCPGATSDGAEELRGVFRTFYAIALAFLCLTPTLHPWYALSLAFLLPFAAGPAGLVLCWSVFLAYRVLIPYTLLGLWIEDDLTPALIAFSPAVAFLIPRAARFVEF